MFANWKGFASNSPLFAFLMISLFKILSKDSVFMPNKVMNNIWHKLNSHLFQRKVWKVIHIHMKSLNYTIFYDYANPVSLSVSKPVSFRQEVWKSESQRVRESGIHSQSRSQGMHQKVREWISQFFSIQRVKSETELGSFQSYPRISLCWFHNHRVTQSRHRQKRSLWSWSLTQPPRSTEWHLQFS